MLAGFAAAALVASVGCSLAVNHFREDGPSTTACWDSPTAADVKAQVEPSAPRHREGQTMRVCAVDGSVQHLPLYFEDPFEDKGHGRTEATDPHNVYRSGWEDYFALPYCFARFTGNWLMLPVSAIVTPPCTAMRSDGYPSRQILWVDHDATPERSRWEWLFPRVMTDVTVEKADDAGDKAAAPDEKTDELNP